MASRDDPVAALERLRDAMNAHDVEAVVACFAPGYESIQPGRPADSFRGTERVRRNWAANFERVPDLRAEILDVLAHGEAVWAEWRYHGTRVDGQRYELRAAIRHTVRDGSIVEARLYFVDAGST